MAKCKFQKCAAECCRYVTSHLSAPRSKADFDEIKWFLLHENVSVYKDHGNDWLIEFKTPCKALNHDQTCKVYETRPDVCSNYPPDDCTANNKSLPHKFKFDTPEQVDKFMAQRWKKNGVRKKKPAAAKKKSAKK